MKTRNTILLFLLAAGLYAIVYFYESKLPSTREAADRATRVVDFDRDEITGIDITQNEGKIELRRKDGEWRLTEPVKDRADETEIASLLTSLESLRTEATLEEKPGERKVDIKDLGLAKPNLRIKLLGNKAPPEILLGKEAAVEGRQYARLEDSNIVYVVSGDVKAQAEKKADDFRDRRLTDLSAAAVNKVQTKTPAGEIELEKDREEWGLNKPLKARGDTAKINDLLASTLTTRIDAFVSGDAAADAAAALGDPRGSVAFFTEGKSDKPVTLQVSKAGGKEKLYAKLSTRDSTFVVPAKIGELFELKPNDLRDKTLTRVNFDTVDRIRIAPAGRPEILLARKEEAWTIKSAGDRPANDGEVRRLASELANQKVTAFVSDVATELPKYGLDQPQLKVTFSAFASENTAESGAGENPITTVHFGRVEGDNVYARLEEEPFIVSVHRSVIDRIYTDPIQWQDLTIYKLKPEEIASIEVTKESQPPIALTREKEEWKLAKGGVAINRENVQALVNALATLSAERWVGPARPEHGLEKPSFVIAFAAGGGQSQRLRVGARGPEGLRFAAADGKEGIFLLTKPAQDAIEAPLLMQPPGAAPAGEADETASPAPAPGITPPVAPAP